MELSQFHDLGRMFDRLIRVDSGHFVCLLSIRLSKSYESGHWFGRLTQVNFFFCFLISFFNIGLIGN
jgi:hypothetical protein